jgi:hypothetical protein
MRKVGRHHRRQVNHHRYYDRANGRRLFFQNPVVPPPGVLDVHQFGLPVPNIPFLDIQGAFGSADGSVFPSIWMYLQDAPLPHDLGRCMQRPMPRSLPLLARHPSVASDPKHAPITPVERTRGEGSDRRSEPTTVRLRSVGMHPFHSLVFILTFRILGVHPSQRSHRLTSTPHNQRLKPPRPPWHRPSIHVRLDIPVWIPRHLTLKSSLTNLACRQLYGPDHSVYVQKQMMQVRRRFAPPVRLECHGW